MLNGEGIGGISTMVRSLALAQSKDNKTEPFVLYGKTNEKAHKDQVECDIVVHHVPVSSGYDVSPLAAYRIIRLFRQVDVLHFHYFSPMYAMCAMICRKPTIYTFHGNFGILRKKTIKDYVKRFVIKYFIRKSVDVVTYNSNFTKKCAEHIYSICNVKTMVIYNGLNIEDISGSADCLPNDVKAQFGNKFVVGACGRLVKIKRIDRLIDAFAAFKDKKSDVALIIVGDGPLRDRLENQIRMRGLSDTARIVGFQRNVFDYEAMFNVCAIPSSGEAFGLVALEALAMGKPAIVFDDGGGLVEIITGGNPADIVSSVEELTERLEAYYAKRHKMSDEAQRLRSHAGNFHIKKAAGKFLEAYDCALASSASGTSNMDKRA